MSAPRAPCMRARPGSRSLAGRVAVGSFSGDTICVYVVDASSIGLEFGIGTLYTTAVPVDGGRSKPVRR
jgi:hypothetical protein